MKPLYLSILAIALSFSAFAIGPIVGPTVVCATANITLSNATPGGTWTSSNTFVATVSNSGVVTATPVTSIATTVISYDDGASVVSTTITALPRPIGIIGASGVCVGANIQLSNYTAGGTWSCNNSIVATISPGPGSTGGILYGNAIGTTNVTYTAPTGCYWAAPTNVVAALPSITSPTTLCGGIDAGMSLVNAVTGGTWTSSNISVATVSGTNIYTASVTTTSTTTITYSVASGCSTNTIVTVNPSPQFTYSVVAGGGHCFGGPAIPYDISGSDPALNYQFYIGSTPVGTPVPGTGGAMNFGSYTAVGYYIVVASYPGTGCSRSHIPIIIEPLPADVPVSGGGTYCPGSPGAGINVGLTMSNTGFSYQLYGPGMVPAGAPVSGSGGPVPFAPVTAVGSYSVMATSTTTGCFKWMSGTATVTAGPTIGTITGPSTMCSGSVETFSTSTPGGTWTSNNFAVATISTTTGIATAVSPGIATISYNLGGCLETKTITVNPLPAPITGPSLICANSQGSFENTSPGGTWSSSSSTIASIGIPSGIAYGVTAGVTNIIYTLIATGCASVHSLTVNPAPDPITGPSLICAGGSSGTMGNTSPGGVWSSSNTTIASIGSTSGIAYGVTAGVTNIIYRLIATSCATTHSLTVGTTTTITGATSICNGSLTQLSTIATGGTWSSSNYSIAAVGIATGLISATGPGTAFITYNTPGGCSATHTITVLPTPAISGNSSVCDGMTTLLSNSSPGGTWTCSNSSLATVPTSTGLVAGFSPGTVNISYTLGSGCSAVMSFTVHPFAPTTGFVAVCEGNSTAFSNTIAGGAWSSSAPAIASINPFNGTALGVSAGTSVISYALPTGCVSTASLTVNPTPTITGPSSMCSGSGVTLSSNLAGGVWSSSNPTVANITSTGIVTGIAPGTTDISYHVGCGAVQSFTVYATPAAIFGGTTVCAGSSITLSNTLAGGLWSATPATIATIDAAGNLFATGAGTALVSYTTPAGCFTTASVSVSALPAVSVSVTPGTTFCAGTAATFTASITDGTPTSYQWYLNSTPFLSATSSIFNVTPLPGDSISVEAVITASCDGSAATYAGTTPIIVNSRPTVTASATTGCGGAYNLNAAGTGLTYLWSPATGLSCSTCAAPIANILTSTSYTVTGTDANGCIDMAAVSLNANRISGYISYTGIATDSFRIWLIHYDPSDSTVTGIDSTVSCMDGGTPYYEFTNPAAGSYMVKAKLFGTIPGTSGYIPTYGLSSPTWDTAVTIAHTSATDMQPITMIYGTVPTGPGFIAGNVYSGAGKGTTPDAPVPGMIVYLRNATTQVLTYTYTDAAGSYAFGNLAYGSYVIYPEEFDYYTTPSAVITLTAATPSVTNINFRQNTGDGTITPYSTTGISNNNNHSSINLFPNPASDQVTLQWSNISTHEVATLIITDITGREVYRTSVNMGMQPGNKKVDVSMLAPGSYQLSIMAASIHYNTKINIMR